MVRERVRALAQRTPVRFAQVAPLPLDGRRSVAFFHHPQWGSVASTEVLSSYGRAFVNSDDVTLVLWLDPGQGVAPERAVEYVDQAMAAAGIDPDATPDVLLVVEPLEPRGLRQLHAAADYVVAPAVAVRQPVLRDLSKASWRKAHRGVLDAKRKTATG
jgi:hypothetical protein